MAGLTDRYTLPCGITLGNHQAGQGGWSGGVLTVYSDWTNSINSSDGNIYLLWSSQYKTFQVQYRTRVRLIPSAQTGADTEAWEAWGSWQGSLQAASSVVKNGNDISLAVPWHPTYDLGDEEYDAVERQYRIRVYDEPTQDYSEWVEKTFRVNYLPTFELSAVFNTDSTVTASLTTNWARAAKFCLHGIWEDGCKIAEQDDEFDVYNGSATFELAAGTIPTANAGYGIPWAAVTYDNIRGRRDDDQEIIALATYDGRITAPEWSYFEDEYGLKLTAKHSTATDVSMVAEWVDVAGRSIAEPMTMVRTGTRWRGFLEAPPFGITPSIKVHVCTSSGYRNFAEDFDDRDEVISKTFSWSDAETDSFAYIRWMADMPSRTSETGAEIVELANGRTVSRHGNATANTFSVSGAVLHPSIDNESLWLSVIDRLSEHHDWWFRSPDGMRKRVTVTNVSAEYMIYGKEAKITVAMREVS